MQKNVKKWITCQQSLSMYNMNKNHVFCNCKMKRFSSFKVPFNSWCLFSTALASRKYSRHSVTSESWYWYKSASSETSRKIIYNADFLFFFKLTQTGYFNVSCIMKQLHLLWSSFAEWLGFLLVLFEAMIVSVNLVQFQVDKSYRITIIISKSHLLPEMIFND